MTSQTTEKPSLSLTRIFPAARDLVWQAWTDPQGLKQWFGPDEGEVTVAQNGCAGGWQAPVLHGNRNP